MHGRFGSREEPMPGWSRFSVTGIGSLSDRDLSRLNGWMELSSFRVEAAQSVLQSLRLGDWMVSLDLQDAYLQVPVHLASRCYLRFCVGDAVYQFRTLCFGLSSAAQVFTRVMAPVSSIMHRHGFHLLRYLDDWLVLGSTFQELVRARDFLLWLCHLLAIIVNPSKSSLVPTRTLDYLGMTFETSPLRVFSTLKRVQKFSLLLQDFLTNRLPTSCVGLEESSRDDVVLVGHCFLAHVFSCILSSFASMRQIFSCSTGISSPGTMAASGIFSGGPTTPIFSSAFLWTTPSPISVSSPTHRIRVGVRL